MNKKYVPREMKIIGNNIKNLRKTAGMTQQKLASVLGVTHQQVQKYEQGKNRLPVDRLYDLRNYWSVPYDAFFAGLDGGQNSYGDHEFLALLMRIKDRSLRGKIQKIIEILIA